MILLRDSELADLLFILDEHLHSRMKQLLNRCNFPVVVVHSPLDHRHEAKPKSRTNYFVRPDGLHRL
jgi:hypothetical protein